MGAVLVHSNNDTWILLKLNRIKADFRFSVRFLHRGRSNSQLFTVSSHDCVSLSDFRKYLQPHKAHRKKTKTRLMCVFMSFRSAVTGSFQVYVVEQLIIMQLLSCGNIIVLIWPTAFSHKTDFGEPGHELLILHLRYSLGFLHDI